MSITFLTILYSNVYSVELESFILCSSTVPFLPKIPGSFKGKKLPKHILEAMTGSMLADGHLRFSKKGKDGKGTGNARYAMTLATKSLGYLTWLHQNIYSRFSPSKL